MADLWRHQNFELLFLCIDRGGSEVAYGNDRYLLGQSTKFGTHIVWTKTKLFGGGYPILKVKVKVRGHWPFGKGVNRQHVRGCRLTSSCSRSMKLIWYSADAQMFKEQISFCLICLSLKLGELRRFNYLGPEPNRHPPGPTQLGPIWPNLTVTLFEA